MADAQKYHGLFAADEAYPEVASGLNAVMGRFEVASSERLTDAHVIIAAYDCPDYEGAAFVLFQRDGKLYEVHGSHCSCYGLEGQWEPEETSVEAIRLRPEHSYQHAALSRTEILDALESAGFAVGLR